MKKQGFVLMTCSVCGGKGHNKRYHQRLDAPQEAKLVPRRSNTTSRNEVQPPRPQPSEFQFMPAPGLVVANATEYDWSDPSLAKRGYLGIENIPIQRKCK
ncbi:Hypothetical predicted protein [Olea europaea subsp. europaea]|uniref:Uncharacterized protein n=1 Tax=Olea europaea subsp. europaea TaxID=158383 RepID=A0A8S0SVK1_OLEEU|nr:Hypothetical predicted protein [Olea europaea subsp. europaea]